MLAQAYLQNALHLFQTFDRQQPLVSFLKAAFRKQKHLGARDRRIISELLFGGFRLGPFTGITDSSKQLISGAFLSGRLPAALFDYWDASYVNLSEADFQTKKHWLKHEQGISFELPYQWSMGVQTDDFWERLFMQPRVFIRIRGDARAVKDRLLHAGIDFITNDANCLSLPAGQKLQDLLAPQDYVIQDLSSQYTLKHLHPAPGEQWWDCCAGSGGKSILVLDACPHIQLTVSDIRESSVHNLHQRMKLYGLQKKYKAFCLDLTQVPPFPAGQQFDAILCDAPCSGSGTWARSPEQFYFFTPAQLAAYTQRQGAIVQQVMPYVKPGGRLHYITCSLFREENEDLRSFVTQHPLWTMEEEVLLHKSGSGGDTLYLTTLRRSGGQIDLH